MKNNVFPLKALVQHYQHFKVSSFIFFTFVIIRFVCMDTLCLSVCMPVHHIQAVPTEARKGCQILWN